MARTKQTARKCSGPPAGKPLFASASKDERPTGKAYLKTLSEYAAQSQNLQSSSQLPVAPEDGATQHSIAEKHTALPDLGPDLLQRVFAALGPHPKDLVPLGAVCRQWRKVLSECTWKELCEKHAPGLVEEVGYNADGAHVPAGSWAALYKLLVYCPGCHFPSFQSVLDSDALTMSENYEWVHGRGHVQTQRQGFRKGEAAKRALYLATDDEVIVSRLCDHRRATENCDHDEACVPPILACRGLVKGFKSSELAKLSGAAAFLSQEEGSEGPPGEPKVGQEIDTGAVNGEPDPDAAEGEMEEEEEDNGASDGGMDSEAEDFEEYPSGSEAESEAESGEEDSSAAEEAIRERAPPCPFCGKLTFALPQKVAFPGTEFTDYDDLFCESCRDSYDWRHREGIYEGLPWSDSDEERDSSMYGLMTGFVCLDGHFVLGAAGYPKDDVPAVPKSGQGLRFTRPEAIEFLLTSVVGEEDLDLKEGQKFIRGLEFDQLIQIEERLSQLKGVWPVVKREKPAWESKVWMDAEDEEGENDEGEGEEKDEKMKQGAVFKTFGSVYVPWYERDSAPVGIAKVMTAKVPADLLKTLQAFVLTGKTSLAECERLILDAFAKGDRAKAEAAARKERDNLMQGALRDAGFTNHLLRDVPPDLLKVWQDFVKTGEPSLEECKRLLGEECEKLKREKAEEEIRSARRETIYGALREAGFNPPMVPHSLSLSTYLKDPTAITVAEVVAQQKRTREESNVCKIVIEGKLCTNPGAKACSNRGCGSCCRKVPNLCRLAKHRKSS